MTRVADPGGGRLDRLAIPVLTLGVVALLVAALAPLVDARADLVGFGRVFGPALALACVPLAALAPFVAGRPRWGLALVGALGAALFLAGAPSRAAPPLLLVDGRPRISLTTWNVYLGGVPPATLLASLAERSPGIVALVELTPDAAAAIEADPVLMARFPHRVLRPAPDWTGMGLLSSWPLEGAVLTSITPPLIAVTVRPVEAPALDVMAVHPPPPLVRLGPFGPTYDPAARDAHLATIRELAVARLTAGRPLVVLGDLNLTDRELEYAELVAAGLTDVHVAAGSGWGHTWRPPIAGGALPGMLRIDMILTGPGVTPLSSVTDCAPRGSDHCLLDAVVALDRVAVAPSVTRPMWPPRTPRR